LTFVQFLGTIQRLLLSLGINHDFVEVFKVMRNAKTLAIVLAVGLGLIFSAPFAAQAKSKKGGGDHESQKGGLPALEDRVEADEVLIADLTTALAALTVRVTTLETKVTALQGQNQFACVNADGTTGNHSTGVTSVLLPTLTGQYEVDFPKDIHLCAPVATLGTNSASSPTLPLPTGIISVAGDPSLATDTGDLGGADSDAIFVQTETAAGTLTNLAFCLYVSCP
jgi:hypothetical protein